MAVRKRDRNQIISQIFEVCKCEGVSKTRIVYPINLNFTTINLYIDALTAGRLLEVLDGQVILYKTAPKGIGILEMLKKLDAQIPEIKH